MHGRRRAQSGHSLLYLLVWVLAVAVLWWQRDALLSRIGTALDVGEAPSKADAALVLAGGWQGERVLKAGELVRQGYVPYVLLSGPHDYYEQPECNYAIPYAVQHGLPAAYFQCAEIAGGGSRTEVAALVGELGRRGVKRVLVVSVDTHMRRLRSLFKEMAPPTLEIHLVSAPSRAYELKQWHKSREGRKAVLLEWVKVVTSWFGV